MTKTNKINKILISIFILLLITLSIVSLYISPKFTASAEENYQSYTGKNLFNINGDINTRYNGTTVSLNTANNILTSNINASTSYAAGQFINVEIGNEYTISFIGIDIGSGIGGGVYIYNRDNSTAISSKTFNSSNLNNIRVLTFIPTEDEILIAFATSGGTGAQFTDIQLEKGNIFTVYEPYLLHYIDNRNYLIPWEDLTTTNVSFTSNYSYFNDYSTFDYTVNNSFTAVGFHFYSYGVFNASAYDYLTVYIPEYSVWWEDFIGVGILDSHSCYILNNLETYLPTPAEAETNALLWTEDLHGNLLKTFNNINNSNTFYLIFYFDSTHAPSISPMFQRQLSFLTYGALSGDFIEGTQAGYDIGYEDGYNAGMINSTDYTLSDVEGAYDNGYDIGYNVGYNDAILESDSAIVYEQGYDTGYSDGYDIGEQHGEYEATMAWNGLVTGSIGGFFGVLQDIGSIKLWSYSISSIWLGISTLMLVIVFLRMLKV